jgi:hypothetical protein
MPEDLKHTWPGSLVRYVTDIGFAVSRLIKRRAYELACQADTKISETHVNQAIRELGLEPFIQTHQDEISHQP